MWYIIQFLGSQKKIGEVSHPTAYNKISYAQYAIAEPVVLRKVILVSAQQSNA